MKYDFSKLSPEELENLTSELANYKQASQVPHEDESQDLDMLEPFAKVLDILIDKVEQLEERITKNESLVVDELFGGIDKMYKSNLRKQSVEGLKGKYGDMFSPFQDGLKELAPDEDIYEVLHDLIEKMKGDEDYSEEKEFGAVKGAADSLASKIAALKGPVTAVEVEVEKVPEESEAEAFMKKVKGMKEKAKTKGL